MSPATNTAGIRRHLVAMPYPGRGHINPMLNLCKLLASKSTSLLITVVVTEEWHSLLASAADLLPSNLTFGVIPQVVPSEHGRAKDFPNFLEATLTNIAAPFENLLDRLQPPPSSIVYDTYMFWAAEVANRRRIPAAAFCTVSASMFTVLSHFDLLSENRHFPLQVSDRGSEVVDYIPGLSPTAIRDLPTFFDGDGRKVLHRVMESISAIPKTNFLLVSSFPELEGPAIEALKSKFPPTTAVLPIGPMIDLRSDVEGDREDYLRWLDSQATGSVLYASMGSFLSTSSAQTEEIVAGIVNTGVPYLMVTRGDDSVYKSAAGDRGRLVGWCDQLRVLKHPAVGGFLSHCGWNSVSEAAFAGVPVLTCPIFWDQVLNGKVVVEDWKMGRRLRRFGEEKVVMREEVAGIVREFMDEAAEGRRKMVESAERVGEACRRAVAPGGSVAGNVDAFLRQILQ